MGGGGGGVVVAVLVVGAAAAAVRSVKASPLPKGVLVGLDFQAVWHCLMLLSHRSACPSTVASKFWDTLTLNPMLGATPHDEGRSFFGVLGVATGIWS